MLNTIVTVVTKLLPVAGSIIGVVEQIYGRDNGDVKKQSYLDGTLAALGQYFPIGMLTNPKFAEMLGRLANIIIEIAHFIEENQNLEIKKEEKK